MSPSASRTEDFLRLAALRRPHGLAGEISAEILGDFAEMLVSGARMRWEGQGRKREIELTSSRRAGNRFLIKLAGCDDRDGAAELCGGYLCVARSRLQRPSSDFLFEDEVGGYACVSPRGEPLGEARGFERLGSQVCLEVAREGRMFLVPYTRPIVVEVDRTHRRLVLDPPDGLFEL